MTGHPLLRSPGSALRARLPLLALVAAGCATTGLTRQDVLQKYDAVAQLSAGLEDARSQDGDLLAPKQLEKTQALLDEATGSAKKGREAEAMAAAEEGLQALDRLEATIADNREVMSPVVDQRRRAVQQGAAGLFEASLKEADEDFREASAKLEAGKVEQARKRRPDLIEKYAQLELRALKEGTVQVAEQAIASAEEAGADDRAPRTLQGARDELGLALSVLDADRTATDKSNAHARKATWLARRAQEITKLAEGFEDASMETVLLWYQGQLQKVREAVSEDTLPFDEANPQVIGALRSDLVGRQTALENAWATNRSTQQRVRALEAELDAQRKAHEDELQATLANHEKQLEAFESGRSRQLAQAQKKASEEVDRLKERLSEEARARAEQERREARAQARFDDVAGLFDKEEAEVFRKGNDVLIRLQGFDFPPGKYEIDAKNYPLLNKVVSAIGTFPDGSVKITGHTDSQGGDARNLELSAARAQSVVTFLSTVGGIDEKRLSSEGKGEQEPVAPNDTSAGRAKNRRIDVLIVTEKEARADM